MSTDSLRLRIACEAARLLYQGRVGDTRTARKKAIRNVARRWVDADQLPSDAEIHDQMDRFARTIEHPHLDDELDRFTLYELLLEPLARISPGRTHHPEGDLLYHSLQVYTLAREQLAYDEEFLTAALLHDAGKAIDPYEHEQAVVDTLGDAITERTAWLILHHTDGLHLLNATLGARARKRLEQSPDFEDLLRLAECDRDGRTPGRQTPDLQTALAELESLAAADDDEIEEDDDDHPEP
jgi:hypothetical protein